MNEFKTRTYTHRGTSMIVFLLFLYIFVLAILAITKSLNNSFYPLLFLTIAFLFCLLCFYNITITIDESYLSIKLGIGLIRKKYEIANIKSCEPHSSIQKRIGVGSKMSLDGNILIYYILSRPNVIELHFHDKQNVTLLIGTNNADEICQYIQSRINKNNKS